MESFTDSRWAELTAVLSIDIDDRERHNPGKVLRKMVPAVLLRELAKGLGDLSLSRALLFGILGHTIQGVSKKVQKLFGGDVQSYINASRVAQGYEEWLQASEEEKKDVISLWKLIQKDLRKKKRSLTR